MDLAMELVEETSALKVHKYAIKAGQESTANKVVFCVAAWKMWKLQPWKVGVFRVEDEEIKSWNQWRNYISGKVVGEMSPSAIDNAALRVEYLLNNKVAWPMIVDALAYFPQAVEDLRNNDQIDKPIPDLMEELKALPNPREARLRVMEEQGRTWVSVLQTEIREIAEDEDIVRVEFHVHCQEILGTTPTSEFDIIISNWGYMTESQQAWLRGRYKPRERAE